MLILRELHRVVGARQAEFAGAYRDEWAPALTDSKAGRLLWYLDQAHGAGPSYTVLTISALDGGSAWEDIAHRVQCGDLRAWAERVDSLRHAVSAQLLLPLPWSPPVASTHAEPSAAVDPGGAPLYVEDTVRPHPGMLAAYIDAAGRWYAPGLRQRGMLALVGAFGPAFGSGGDDVVLLQRVVDSSRLMRMIAGEPAASPDGTRDAWMREALRWRDRWVSRLLRAAPWSPLQ